MNIETSEKIENNIYTHKKNGSKASLMEISENEYNKVYSHNRNASKSSITEAGIFKHNRNGSKSSITNVTNMIGQRKGTFRKVIINDRGSSLQKNNLDSHVHKSSHSNLRKNLTNDFLISTRESSLFYNNNNNNNNDNNNNNIDNNNNSKDNAKPYTSHSRENLNFMYHYSKPSPTSSPRDANNSPLGYKAIVTENQSVVNNGYLPKTSALNTHYSPNSTTPISPAFSRENYYSQKENMYILSNSPTTKDVVISPLLKNKKMKLWTLNDVLNWLTDNNLEKYKESFKDMKMDGKTLMKQNYETLLDLTIVDRVKIISLRNATLQIEKENEKNNNQQYTPSPRQMQMHDKLFVPNRDVDLLKNDASHMLTKSRSFESLVADKENGGTTPTSETFTLPRKVPTNQNNFFTFRRNASVDDKEDLGVNKIPGLVRTTSLKKKMLNKDESLNQQPVITPRSSSRNIEINKYRRRYEHGYENIKIKTPTSGGKSNTPLKDIHFMFNYANSPNSAKEPTFEMASNYGQSPIKSAEAMTYEEKLKEDIKLNSANSTSPLLKGMKSMSALSSPGITPIPKFLIKISNTKQTQSHTLDITNYTNEIKLWERIFTKFDIALTKENFENYSFSLIQNGQINQKVPLSTNDLMNMIKSNEGNTMIELVLESKVMPKPKSFKINNVPVIPISSPISSARSGLKNANIRNITETINKSKVSNIKLTTVPPKDKNNLLSNIKPEIKKFGERPPSMEICDQLEQYFPDVNKTKSEKIKSIVMENIKYKRLSRLSRLSQSRSSFSSYDDQSMISEESYDEMNPEIKKMYFKKPDYQVYSVKRIPTKVYQKAEMSQRPDIHHEEILDVQEIIPMDSVSNDSRKTSFSDKRNSRKALSIITSPDKLKELSIVNKIKTYNDSEGNHEVINDPSTTFSNEERETEFEVEEEDENENNDEIYTNEITDYSSEISSEIKTFDEISTILSNSTSFTDQLNNFKELINLNKEYIKSMEENDNDNEEENDNENENENDDEIEPVTRSKRNGQYINKGNGNANQKRRTRSILGDIERIYDNLYNIAKSEMKNSEESTKEKTVVNSESSTDSNTNTTTNDVTSTIGALTPTTTTATTNSITNDNDITNTNTNNTKNLNTMTSNADSVSENVKDIQTENDNKSNESLSEKDVITPRPDKRISEIKRNHRALKGISVVSVGRKSIYSMNLKQKVMPSEARFSIMVPQKPLHWVKGQLIGQGSFSKVYHGLNLETGEIMAVKQVELCLPMSQENDEESKKKNKQMLDALHHEIKLLKDLNHENIVRYLGFELTDTSSNVFLEYVSGGSVSSLIAKIGKFEEPLVKSLTSQIASGIQYLHNRSIIHRDIKGANILVDEDGVAKISDFGISKKNEYEMAYKYNSRMSFQGSIFWMAPEVIRGKGYSAKVDIWSLGCVVLEMFTGVHPWKQYNEIQTVMYNLGMMNKPYIPKRLSPESQDLLNICLDVNPEKRPTAKQIRAHSFCKPPEVPFNFREYYQKAIEKVNNWDLSNVSAMSNDMTSNSEMTSYDMDVTSYDMEMTTEEINNNEDDMIIKNSIHSENGEDHQKNSNVLTNETREEEEEEEEESDINLENIIPRELKIDTIEEEEEEEEEEEDINDKNIQPVVS
ncbi:Pkinase-domain-containing protein [Neocallimastix lanati (nom. inval.)]|jgi:serine/threonine protein kinase|uniref:Pkinase-domain-containing protein n=1 Tax=Neocallimastix californiae TaxID=1754190 RepID=A0A1Y2FSH1_9FUNG|nr:Pkinase-domain-containing protein [Neocallimastix sp. JGI-2020a]ORY86537.1 Pkinase-domain-containing protein [Neocallimastix californiae]|eukprot:ORY86537.1 Pkinase-domain-containing protein [Neocallimastix californiae]